MNTTELHLYFRKLSENYHLVRLELYGDGSGCISYYPREGGNRKTLFNFANTTELDIAVECGDFT